MITVEHARHLIQSTIRQDRTIRVPLIEALRMVLARDVVAKDASPRFDASAMDGYAVRIADLEVFQKDGRECVLPISGDIRAGDNTKQQLKAGTATAIATGARVPTGADAIIIKEECIATNGAATFNSIPNSGAFIRPRGGEYQKGSILFHKGTLISPPVMGCLASMGIRNVAVYKRPSVAIVVTGNEVKRTSARLRAGEIRDANSISLKAALATLGIFDVQQYHVKDTLRDTIRVITRAMRDANFVIITGGVSVGNADFVREALKTVGVKEVFWRVKTKPGKPLYFGTRAEARQRQYVFGLPGNPVSVMVTFHQFVRPAILQSMGYPLQDQTISATLTENVTKEKGRTEFVRGWLEPNSHRVTALRERDSHMLSGMAKANCLIVLPEEEIRFEQGTAVNVIPLRWSIL